MWLSVGADLKIDSRRDLDDVGAPDVEVYPLNKMPYQDLDTAKVQTWLLCKLQEQCGMVPDVLPWQRCTHANLGTAKVLACLLAWLWPICTASAVLLTFVLRPWAAMSQPACLHPSILPGPHAWCPSCPLACYSTLRPLIAPALVDCSPFVCATVSALRCLWLTCQADLCHAASLPCICCFPLKGGAQDGVLFSTYSSLISSSDKGLTRLQQVVDWCGKAKGATPDTFDGLILFDE